VCWKCPDGDLEIRFTGAWPFKKGKTILTAGKNNCTDERETQDLAQTQSFPYTATITRKEHGITTPIDPELEVEPGGGNDTGPRRTHHRPKAAEEEQKAGKGAKRETWAYQGVECYVAKKELPGYVKVQLTPREPDGEGPWCWVAQTRLRGYAPLHRLRRQAQNDRYCVTIDELDAHASEGYQNQRPVGYVKMAQDLDHVPLMRTYNPKGKRYYYTTDVTGEVDPYAPEISSADAAHLLRRTYKDFPVYNPDDSYFCPTKEAARQIIDDSLVARLRYSQAAMDCDDFAHLLKGAFIEDAYNIYDVESSSDSGPSKPYAVGVVRGLDVDDRVHYMNVLVTSEGLTDQDGNVNDYSIWLVEPQSGELIEPSKFPDHLRSIGVLMI